MNTEEKALKINPENIPEDLKSLENWVGWKPEERSGNRTKVPYDPSTGELASSTDPETWVDFDTLKNKPKYGLGFVFTNTPFAGVDLDGCRNSDTGELASEAQKIVDRLDSYTEISPSGTGLHIIVEGSFTGGGNKTGDVDGFKELEMYHTARYFTVTGNVLDNEKTTIEPRQDELEELHKEFFSGRENGEGIDFDDWEGNELSDDEVLDKAKSSNDDLFAILWDGDMEKYKEIAKNKGWDSTPSGADYHICQKLAFYTGGDPDQMERLFSQSKLVREKWKNREDYRLKTIKKALNAQDDFYKPPQKKPPGEKETASSEDEKNVPQKLLEIAEQASLFRTANNRMFAEVTEKGKSYVFEIKQKGASGGKFRHWVIRNYKKRYGKSPNSTSVSRTMEVVRADCAIAEEREIYKRIADLGDRILVDLAGDQRRAIKVAATGYEIVENPDVNFWRPDGARELPEPKGKVGDLKYLRNLINLEKQDFSLLIAWLLATFQTVGPYPILIPTGPAGSGKSTLTKLIRNLLDPAGKTGRATTGSVRQSEDLFSVAKHRHVLALDNISQLRQWQSDTLSAIATGGGLEKRQLYTDDNLVTIDTMNPIVMNGIDISGIGDDLLDRAIFLHLEEPTERVEEQEIWDKFEQYHAKILGGLCGVLTTTLANRYEIELTQEEISRMADFTRWVKAARPAIQKIEGLKNIDPLGKYHENRSTAGRDALLESELGSTLVEFLESREADDNMVLWQGKTSELLEKLEERASEKAVESKEWPGSAVPLGKKLTQIKTTLDKIDIKFERVDGTSGTINKLYQEVPF